MGYTAGSLFSYVLTDAKNSISPFSKKYHENVASWANAWVITRQKLYYNLYEFTHVSNLKLCISCNVNDIHAAITCVGATVYRNLKITLVILLPIQTSEWTLLPIWMYHGTI